MTSTGQEEEEGEDQRIIHTSQLTTDSSRRITLMILQIRGATGSSWELRRSIWRWQFRGRAVPHHGLRSAWRIGWIGWAIQTVTLECDNEPGILPPAPEIRRLRREGSITIFEHFEEGEKQSNHLAEGSVNIVKRL